MKIKTEAKLAKQCYEWYRIKITKRIKRLYNTDIIACKWEELLPESKMCWRFVARFIIARDKNGKK
jgi:hypothetical protein